jgi:glycosyltransferase involved in cell wall biosynthesis
MVTVSVCVPAHENSRTIGQLIESVLGQSFDDLELVIVDDCSSDRTVQIAASYPDPRIRLSVNERNLGAVANWNRSIQQARGRYVKLLCGDDYLYPTCLERQVKALDRHAPSGVVIASCRRDIVYEDGSVAIHGRGLADMDGVVAGGGAIRRAVRSGTNPFGEPAAVLIRADVLAQCGPFSDRFPYVVDLDVWCRALERGDLYADQEPLCAFRVRHTSWSRRLARHQGAQVSMLFREIRARQPDLVTRQDEMLGRLRSHALMAGRRLAYVANGARHGEGRTSPGPAAISPPPPR